jgi:hypothetical protein
MKISPMAETFKADAAGRRCMAARATNAPSPVFCTPRSEPVWHLPGYVLLLLGIGVLRLFR